ncbi:MAG: histidine phosphatase family protein [Pseudomonadota bacterium]
MRHLIIMRHGKAERGEGKADFDRTIEPRGTRESFHVAEQMATAGLSPDTILCSAARRTRDTLAAVLPHVRGDCEIHLIERLYDADVADLREAMRKASGQTVLLIGHNPSVHGLSLMFAGGDAGEVGDSFPTATAAAFSMGFAVDTVRFERLFVPDRGATSGLEG